MIIAVAVVLAVLVIASIPYMMWKLIKLRAATESKLLHEDSLAARQIEGATQTIKDAADQLSVELEMIRRGRE